MVGTGIDGWSIEQDWADTESFNQDLFIRAVPDFANSVWFDPNSLERDRSTANWAVRLVTMTKEAYDEKYPKGSGLSISEDKSIEYYYEKPDQVVIANFLLDR